jgi:type IV fimbrial biogenesis protein FimT
MGEWLQNSQIRTAAEVMAQGLQAARADAVRRNTSVRFSLVDTLDSSCSLSATGQNWIVSRNDPSGQCDVAEITDFIEPNDSAIAQILQKRLGAEGTPNALIAATDDAAASSNVTFNSLGRVSNANGIDTIEVSNPSGGACKADGGNMRCLRVTISIGGDVRTCDPSILTAGDTRKC